VLAGDEGALLDGPVQRFFVAHRDAWLTPLMRSATNLGNAAVLIGLILLAGLAWWWRRRTWRPLWLLAGAHLGAWVLSDTVKDLTHRARPPAAQAIGHWTGYAFPSGHTTKATAVYGMLAALLAATTARWGRKVTLWTAAALLVGLVGLSRLYLGGALADRRARCAHPRGGLAVCPAHRDPHRARPAHSTKRRPPGSTPPPATQATGDPSGGRRVGGAGAAGTT
jgi:hypothetical protein